MMDRRRVLMVATAEPPIDPINFTPGSFTQGTSAWNVAENNSGEFTVTAWIGMWANRIAVKMSRSIEISTGDVVRFVAKKVSGTLSASQFAEVALGGLSIQNNGAWNNGATAIDKTVTATSNVMAQTINISNRSGTATATNYKVKITIYINGQQVFPLP